MDIQHCSDHPDKEAAVYCVQDKVLLCVTCLIKHKGHDFIDKDDFRKAKTIKNKVSLIQETSTLLATHKIKAASLFNVAEAYLGKQKEALIGLMPEMLKQTSFKNLENGKKLE